MAISVTALHPVFVAEVAGVDLREPVDQATFRSIEQALDDYAVLVFRGQPLTAAQQIAFSSLFGPLETAFGSIRSDRKSRLGNRVIADVSNLDGDNQIRGDADPWRLMQLGNQLWHTDSSYKRVPGKISFLSAHELPPSGGETEFADLRAAYDALDPSTRARIEGLVAEHSMFYSRSLVGCTDFTADERNAMPPVPQTLVRVLSGSGRQTLYLATHASHVIRWPIDRGRALLDELTAFATQPRFVHQHRWRLHDFVMWDNRCTMHRGRPYDDTTYRRDMRRTTIEDSASSIDQSPARGAAQHG